jgi:hypothetical protein
MIWTTPVLAITYTMNWTGLGGYYMTGAFSFDATTAPTVIVEQGDGPTNHLESLTASFFDPFDGLVLTATPVQEGVSSYPSLKFIFDTANESFIYGSQPDPGIVIGVSGDWILMGDRYFIDLWDIGHQGRLGNLYDSSPGAVSGINPISYIEDNIIEAANRFIPFFLYRPRVYVVSLLTHPQDQFLIAWYRLSPKYLLDFKAPFF